MIPTGMPAYTAPTLVQVGNPLDLDYVLTDNTPFQPAETRIYRIRKSGMVLAEKSVSSFSGFNSTMQQQAGLRAKERSKELALSISPNPTEEESAISFMLPTAQSIRLILTDIFGRTVQTMYDGKAESGESVFVAHLQNLPSGTYWVRLFGESGVSTMPIHIRK